jgi:hypothetical protein
MPRYDTRSWKRLRTDLQLLVTKYLQMQELIEEHLKNHPCVDCGESDLRVLDFDHVHGPKTFAISQFAEVNIDFDMLLVEIAKCEVRCRHCHSKRHWPVKHRYLMREYAETQAMKQTARRVGWEFSDRTRRTMYEFLE